MVGQDTRLPSSPPAPAPAPGPSRAPLRAAPSWAGAPHWCCRAEAAQNLRAGAALGRKAPSHPGDAEQAQSEAEEIPRPRAPRASVPTTTAMPAWRTAGPRPWSSPRAARGGFEGAGPRRRADPEVPGQAGGPPPPPRRAGPAAGAESPAPRSCAPSAAAPITA